MNNWDDSILTGLDEQLKRTIELKETWKAIRVQFEPIMKRLDAEGIESSFDGDFNLRFSGDKKKLTSIIRLLRTNGWDYKEDIAPPKENEPSWSAFWHHPDLVGTRIWFWFTSSVCRRIQVGTRTVEEPIFETRCGEETQPLIDNDIPF